MDRRKFIRNVSLFAAALACSDNLRSAATDGKQKNKIFVGAHVWVYAASQPGYDVSPVLSQIFSDMAYAGFDGVELMVSVGKPSVRIKTETELDNQADLLKKLIQMAEKKGIALNLHNHTYEVENNMFDLRGTLKRIPDVKLGPDLNWLLRGGVDPIKFLREFRNQIIFTHLRDQLSNGKWPESLGEGDVNFSEISDVFKEIGFRGDVVIELAHESGFVNTRPLRESLKMSRDHLKKTMNI
ncbi:MAG: sugar phosphate isomerase/epimerase [Bacteroidia bacterium]|nr:sugar phosphate isomerase/epimerase [Bacteroidia bacterium]